MADFGGPWETSRGSNRCQEGPRVEVEVLNSQASFQDRGHTETPHPQKSDMIHNFDEFELL